MKNSNKRLKTAYVNNDLIDHSFINNREKNMTSIQRPEQTQKFPGEEKLMHPQPKIEDSSYEGSNKLKNEVAIITGADSGIGKAIAIAFAKEGADIVASYLCEEEDAQKTKKRVEELGRKCILVPGDISESAHCQKIVDITLEEFKKVTILVNHAGEQYQTNELADITDESLEKIFRVNVFSLFYLTRAALTHMKENSSIINTVSVVAYEGNPKLIDYTATKAAGVGFTRALSHSLVQRKIRVNGVAPGPIWTPLIPASFDPKRVSEFGSQTPMGRAGEPYEVAPAYVYLASHRDSSYVTGQVIHVNGGKVLNT